MAYSTLYAVTTLPVIKGVQDPAAFVVGVLVNKNLVIHGQPGSAVDANASATYFDGSTAWTWGKVAAQYPALCAVCLPHRWNDEAIDTDVVTAAWPLLTSQSV